VNAQAVLTVMLAGERSPDGPCIVHGEIIGETARQYYWSLIRRGSRHIQRARSYRALPVLAVLSDQALPSRVVALLLKLGEFLTSFLATSASQFVPSCPLPARPTRSSFLPSLAPGLNFASKHSLPRPTHLAPSATKA
jgi:hypothetical protein